MDFWFSKNIIIIETRVSRLELWLLIIDMLSILLIVLFLYIDDIVKGNVGMIRIFIFLIHCYY